MQDHIDAVLPGTATIATGQATAVNPVEILTHGLHRQSLTRQLTQLFENGTNDPIGPWRLATAESFFNQEITDGTKSDVETIMREQICLMQTKRRR